LSKKYQESKSKLYWDKLSLERTKLYRTLKIILKDVFDEVARIFEFQYGDLVHLSKISQLQPYEIVEPVAILISYIQKYTQKQTFYPNVQFKA